jgi:hypothetical protein
VNKKYNINYDPKELNDARRLSGLKEILFKQRVCLRCEEKFNSEGNHNRLCDSCRKKYS